MEKLYYSRRKFEDICCWCGAPQPDATINDEMRTAYKVVNPVCQECKAAWQETSHKLQKESNGRGETSLKRYVPDT